MVWKKCNKILANFYISIAKKVLDVVVEKIDDLDSLKELQFER